MSSKKITTLLLILLMVFAAVIAVQGLMGLLGGLKERDQAAETAPGNLAPGSPALGSDISQEGLERIRSTLGDANFREIQEQLNTNQERLLQVQQLACALNGGTWDFVKSRCDPGR